MTTKRKTVKVRIAVAVDETGDWAVATATNGQTDAAAISDAVACLANSGEPTSGYIVTATLAAPSPQTIKGKVTAAKGGKE